ncbi:BnaC05g10710D [Brassica napus]|uniref:BnaC05g10710D protein n=1 Tax=Brassica napus TaxID=3708 RepID=A0A078HRC6_BRANA|nr:BnaC05g10710D [Brassica napus]
MVGVVSRLQRLFSQIELSFSASNLRDRHLMSKSEAMVVVEVVLNSLNPKWIKKLTLSYQLELVHTLLFCVFDIDTQFQNSREEMLKLDEQQFLGEATCTLSEIKLEETSTANGTKQWS